jgi:hypothetical protein
MTKQAHPKRGQDVNLSFQNTTGDDASLYEPDMDPYFSLIE